MEENNMEALALCPVCSQTHEPPAEQVTPGAARMPDGRAVILCLACEISKLHANGKKESNRS